MKNFILRQAPPAKRKRFILATSVAEIENLTSGKLPEPGEIIKLVSLNGNIASLAFISWVARHEAIDVLQASTFRIGPKQYEYLDLLAGNNRLGSARFIFSKAQQNVDTTKGRNYAAEFIAIAARRGWKCVITNNHSKIILIKTPGNAYVLETSSNLNENPMKEHFSFTNDPELYDFYNTFFDRIENCVEGEDGETELEED